MLQTGYKVHDQFAISDGYANKYVQCFRTTHEIQYRSDKKACG